MPGRSAAALAPFRRAGAVMDEHRTEHGRGSGRCLPGDHQPRVVRANRNVAQGSLNSPRQRVIQSAPLCHSPNHILPATSPHRNARVCWTDRAFGKKRADYIAPPVVPGATHRKPAVFWRNGVPPSHPLRRVAPDEELSLQEGVGAAALVGRRRRTVSAFPQAVRRLSARRRPLPGRWCGPRPTTAWPYSVAGRRPAIDAIRAEPDAPSGHRCRWPRQ